MEEYIKEAPRIVSVPIETLVVHLFHIQSYALQTNDMPTYVVPLCSVGLSFLFYTCQYINIHVYCLMSL